MSAMGTIRCHQYAVGRGLSGYGFVEYSRKENNNQDATYQFSLGKGMNLRFSQLSNEEDCILEIDPASTDYLHMGAYMTRNRVAEGTRSLYTHVLMTDEPCAKEALGLLKERNFLTPDQFSEVTRSKLTLRMEEKDCSILSGGAKLDDEQKKKLGEFLARYWWLLEQREWQGKERPEVALILPGFSREEMISFFADEIVSRLPEYVRPAISASFGASWDNRGTFPAVCCVLPDTLSNPYPYYDLGQGGTNYARPAKDVEERIGQILISGRREEYPETYQKIENLAKEDGRYRAMARCYTTMAYCVQAELSRRKSQSMDPLLTLRKVYDALVQLGEKRFRIPAQEMRKALLPLTYDIYDCISRKKEKNDEDMMFVINDNIQLHRSALEAEEHQSVDEKTFGVIESLSNDRNKIDYLWKLHQSRDDGGVITPGDLLSLEKKIIEKVKDPKVTIIAADLQMIGRIRSIQGLAHLENEKSYQETGDILASHFIMWQEELNYSVGGDEREEKYSTDHFPEIVSKWLKSKEASSFDSHTWTISNLEKTIKSISDKLAQQKGNTAEITFDILEPAEKKLLELHQKENAGENTISSAAKQIVRLSEMDSENAKNLSKLYMSLLLERANRAGLYEYLTKNDAEIWKHPEIVAELLTDIKDDIKANENEIVSYIRLTESLREFGLRDRLTPLDQKYPEIVSQAAEIRGLSPEGWSVITSYVLRKKPDDDTFRKACNIAESYDHQQEAIEFLEQLTAKKMETVRAGGGASCNLLLRMLESAQEKGLSSEKLDAHIDELLEKNKNQLPDPDMPHCKKIAQKRVQDALRNCFQKTHTADPGSLKAAWNAEYEDRYSCAWEHLTQEQFSPLVHAVIDNEYQASDDKVAYLTTMWEKVGSNSGEEYTRALKSNMIQKVEDEYDILWRNCVKAPDVVNRREILDKMIDDCLREDTDKIHHINIKSTTAWKAREFTTKLKSLCRQGVSGHMEDAGNLLREAKKEMGFDQCINFGSLDLAMQANDPYSSLMVTLVSELLHAEGDQRYWEPVLQEIGFTADVDPWSGEGPRMVNILSYLTNALSEMKAAEIARDLKAYLGGEYINRLWNEKVNKEHFKGAGDRILSASLYQWIMNG